MNGRVLDVTVKPGAKAPGIVIGADGSIVVRVRERATEGKANEAVRRSLAAALRRAPTSVRLVGGATGRRKRFEIEGLTAVEATSRLRRCSGPSENDR